MFSNYADRVLSVDRDNIVRGMYLNEQSGSTVQDNSPNNRTGAVNSATPSGDSQPSGMNAFTFDGVNDWIDLTSFMTTDFPDSSEGTILMWVKEDDWFDSSTDVYTEFNAGAGTNRVEIIKSGANDRLAIAWQNTSYEKFELAGMDALVGNDWFCVVVTWNSGTPIIKMFIDGIDKGNDTTAFGVLSGVFDRGGIGARSDGSFPMNGSIGFVAVWDIVLSDANLEYLGHMS